jgi:hypothetical protein
VNAAVTDEMAPDAIELALEVLRRKVGVPESRRLEADPAMLDEKIEWALQAACSRIPSAVAAFLVDSGPALSLGRLPRSRSQKSSPPGLCRRL